MTVVFPSGFTKHGPFSENEFQFRLRYNFGEFTIPWKSPIIDEHPGPPFNLANIITSFCKQTIGHTTRWKVPIPENFETQRTRTTAALVSDWTKIFNWIRRSPWTCSFQHRDNQISDGRLESSRKRLNLWQNEWIYLGYDLTWTLCEWWWYQIMGWRLLPIPMHLSQKKPGEK